MYKDNKIKTRNVYPKTKSLKASQGRVMGTCHIIYGVRHLHVGRGSQERHQVSGKRADKRYAHGLGLID
jgi:hypothetical protein